MKKYQVELFKEGKFYSVLCNNQGKTKICLATARKWAYEYTKTFLSNSDCLQTLLKITLVE